MTHNYVMTSRAVKGWALMRMSPQRMDFTPRRKRRLQPSDTNWVEPHNDRSDNSAWFENAAAIVVVSPWLKDNVIRDRNHLHCRVASLGAWRDKGWMIKCVQDSSDGNSKGYIVPYIYNDEGLAPDIQFFWSCNIPILNLDARYWECLFLSRVQTPLCVGTGGSQYGK